MKSMGLFCLMLTQSACGEGQEERRWECYEDSSDGHCDCFGVEEGSDVTLGETGTERVAECVGYETCFSYEGEYYQGPMCSCGGADYMPPDGVSEIDSVPSCPE